MADYKTRIDDLTGFASTDENHLALIVLSLCCKESCLVDGKGFLPDSAWRQAQAPAQLFAHYSPEVQCSISSMGTLVPDSTHLLKALTT